MQIHRKKLLVAILILGWVTAQAVYAQDSQISGVIIEDVRIFDGKSDRLSPPSHVLVVGNSIKAISSTPIADVGMTVQRIRGGGRTLMPGLIDNHWHTMLARPTPALSLEGDVGYLNFLAGAEAEATLLRGFTSVRDLGGPSFG